MSVNERVITALSPLGVPVAFQTYSGEADPYITFFTYLEQPEQHADDRETITGRYVQVDLWVKGDYTDLAALVDQRMTAAGFRRINAYDLYEKDVRVYHKVLRYVMDSTVI